MSLEPEIIDISDDEEVPAWEQLPARCAILGLQSPPNSQESTNDLEADTPGPSTTRPMTFEQIWDSDGDSSWFHSDDEPARPAHLQPEIRYMATMVEAQFADADPEMGHEADDEAVDIESMFPEDISEPSDSEHHPRYEHDQPSATSNQPHQLTTCRRGHVFPDLHLPYRGIRTTAADIPDSPMSPPAHEQAPGPSGSHNAAPPDSTIRL